MKIKTGLKTLIMLALSYLVIGMVINTGHILRHPLAWASESGHLTQAEDPHADSPHSTPAEHRVDYGTQVSGHAEHGGHETFFGYEAIFAFLACIYYALVLRIWPTLFAKHEGGVHH